MVSDISFISDKTMSRYSREFIKKNNENIGELSHSIFKHNSFNRSGVNFPIFA